MAVLFLTLLTLWQERLDELYQDERSVVARRRNIGLEADKKSKGSESRKIRMSEFRKQQRADPDLERAARHNTLEVHIRFS